MALIIIKFIIIIKVLHLIFILNFIIRVNYFEGRVDLEGNHWLFIKS